MSRLPNSIGYVEYAYVKQNKMTYAQLQNAAGSFVSPDDSAFKAAAAGADWSKTFYQVLTNQPGKESWPITGATFILMHKAQDKPAQAATTLKFFDWAYKNGDKTADDLDYVPMPATVKSAIAKAWGEIKDASGKPVALQVSQQDGARMSTPLDRAPHSERPVSSTFPQAPSARPRGRARPRDMRARRRPSGRAPAPPPTACSAGPPRAPRC